MIIYFNFFVEEVSYAHQGCIYWSKYSNEVVLPFKIIIINNNNKLLLLLLLLLYFNLFKFLMVKLNFQHHYSSLQCHMILQNHSKIADLLLKEHSLLLSMLKTVVVVLLFTFVISDFYFCLFFAYLFIY